MRVTVITPPSAEPLSLADAKAHLRVDGADENALITALITVARQYVESYCNRSIGLQTIEVARPCFDVHMELPRPPLRSVQSITYLDTAGVDQTLASTIYRTIASSDDSPGLLELISGQGWPSIGYSLTAVRIRYTAGADLTGSPVDTVPDGLVHAMKLVIGDLYEHREAKLDAEVYNNPTVAALLAPYRIYTL